MQIKAANLGVATYLTPDGALVEKNLPALGESIQQARQRGTVNLVLDLHKVPFFDSRGLEFLLDLVTELQEQGGALRLANPSQVCKDILKMTRLDQSIAVYIDLESARRSFL